MKNNCVFKVNANESIFDDVFDEYDYEIMLAKDNAVAKVLKEISNYFHDTYTGLLEKGKAIISLNKAKEFNKLLTCLSAEVIETENCSYLRTDYMPNIYLPDFNIIRVYGEVNFDIKNKTFEYEVLFDNELSLIIIQDQERILILDLYEDIIMDNTYSDDETDAILYTLAFIVSGFKQNKNNVISLADYKRRKNIK